MSYQKHNFTPGAVLLASQLNDMDNEIESLSQGGSGGTVLSDNFKTALLNCFENVAWINENGQLYYNALYNSLYSNDTWSITNLLSGCVTSNNAVSILKNNSYVATISPNQGYTLEGATISITMGGNDVTNLFYSSGSINIPNVTGDLVISVTAASSVTSISAVFTQGTVVIYPTTPLNDLKQYLTVTATWSDTSTSVVPSADYTLSGTLTTGTSTITVSYGGKTTTFTCTVSAQSYVTSGLLHHYDGIDNTGSGHNSSATTWTDLVGTNTLTMNNTTYATWDTNALNLVGTSGQWLQGANDSESPAGRTMEICVDIAENQASTIAVLFSNGSPYNGKFVVFSDNTFNVKGASSHSYTHSGEDLTSLHHIAASFTSSNEVNTVYANGSPTTTGSASHSMSGQQAKMVVGQLGATTSGSQYPYKGKIYSIRVYDRILTDAEIAQNYAVDVTRFNLGS